MPGESTPSWLRYAGIGVESAGAVAVLTLVGWWVDGRFGSAPWGTLAGAMLGLVGGLYNLVREAMSATHPAGEETARRSDAGSRRDEEP